MPKQERGLGRGLDAIFAVNAEKEKDNDVMDLDLDQIKPRPDQPRRHFEEEAIQELANSIKEHGILQPVLVRSGKEGFELIAGERRWRAAQMAGLSRIKAIVKEMGDLEAGEISLVENLQREDLNVVEEAKAYLSMMNNYGYTQEMLAKRVGKSRAHIANTVRILNLPKEIVTLLEAGKISAGHARALLSISNKEDQKAEAREIVRKGLSVREVETRVKNKKAKKAKTIRNFDLELAEFETKIQDYLGTRVEIKAGKKGGNINISYYDDQDLERIMETMGMKIKE